MNPALKSKQHTAPTRGMTLVELTVATGIGSLVMLGMLSIFVTSNRTFASMGNYSVMEQTSRSALDQMTRDIRGAKNLLSFSTNQLVFNYLGSTNLNYLYEPASGQLSQWMTGGPTTILLSGCDYLSFSMYSNLPQPGGVFTNFTANVSQGKCISIAWRCSRSILGKKINTEDMQQAVIVIRNKPVQ